MKQEEMISWLKKIEKDIFVCSLESTFEEDAKSCAIHEAIQKLEKQTDWISVAERLPEKDGRYRVTVEFEHKDGYEDYQTSIATFEDGEWWDLEDAFIGEPKRIAAWMPYNEPEPWKGEE